MTVFAVPRAEFLRAMGMMGQLAGALKSSITLCPLADDLVISTVGVGVAAVCHLPIVESEVDDGEREVLTMPAQVATTIRAAHKPPRDKDAKAMWLLGVFRVELRRNDEITVEQIDVDEVFDSDVLLTSGVGSEPPMNGPWALNIGPIREFSPEEGELPAVGAGMVAALNAMSRFYGPPTMEILEEGLRLRFKAGTCVAVASLSTLMPSDAFSEQLVLEAARVIAEAREPLEGGEADGHGDM